MSIFIGILETGPGDLVRLRSGGPNMTVAAISAEYQTVECLWMNASGDMNYKHIPGACLYKVVTTDE